MTDPATPALLVRAAEAEVLDGDPGGTITLLADAADTAGALTAHRSTFRGGAPGAPPHVHTGASELFLVLDGALRVLVDRDVRVLRAGDLLVVPPRVPHAFEAAPGRDAEVLFVLVLTAGGPPRVSAAQPHAGRTAGQPEYDQVRGLPGGTPSENLDPPIPPTNLRWQALAPGRERSAYYRLLDRVHRGLAPAAEIAATQEEFDNHYVDSPAWRARGE